VNSELVRIWKEAVVVKVKVLSRHSLEGVRKTTEILSQDSRFPGRDLNPEPPEYETGAMTTRLRSSLSLQKQTSTDNVQNDYHVSRHKLVINI
jgi:hypothetical protein